MYVFECKRIGKRDISITLRRGKNAWATQIHFENLREKMLEIERAKEYLIDKSNRKL